jgi:hypothetical protein
MQRFAHTKLLGNCDGVNTIGMMYSKLLPFCPLENFYQAHVSMGSSGFWV